VSDPAEDGGGTPAKAPDEKERLRRRRSRSLAIALLLAALVVLFYVITVLKMAGSSGIPEV